MLRKAAGVIVLIFVAVWISQSPAHAGNSVHHWINSTITFIQHLN